MVRLSLFTLPDAKDMNRMSIPTKKRKTPNLLTMQAMINEMGETSNDSFSHSRCDSIPEFPVIRLIFLKISGLLKSPW